MARVLIVADDLTGANDSAVQFAERGFSAVTLLPSFCGARSRTAACGACAESRSVYRHAQVLSVTTESRNLPREDAADRVRRVVEPLLSSFRPDVVLKKIDSTLRGNVQAEVNAVAGLAGGPAAIVAPAYPSNGRTVAGGYLLVDGVPLAGTYAGRETLAPVQSSYLPDYFRGTPASMAMLDFELIGRGVKSTREALEGQVAQGCRLVLADSLAQGDLATLVEAVKTARAAPFSLPVLWVGSAGLARALAESLSKRLVREPVEQEHGWRCSEDGKTLVLYGSLNPMALEQVRKLEDAPGCLVIRPKSTSDLDVVAGQILESTGGSTVVISENMAGSAGPGSFALAKEVKSFFARLAARVLESGVFDALVLSGGDIASCVLGALGARATGIETEILPGVAFGLILGGQARGVGVVTKAGGFGGPAALGDILQWLASCRRRC